MVRTRKNTVASKVDNCNGTQNGHMGFIAFPEVFNKPDFVQVPLDHVGPLILRLFPLWPDHWENLLAVMNFFELDATE